MNVIIRHADAADANIIMLLSAELGYSVTEENTRSYIDQINSSDKDVLYVAIVNDRVAGWIHVLYTVRIECAPFCEIGGLVVSKQYRGASVGKQLVKQARDWAAQRSGVLKVRTNVLRKETHLFYASAGFREVKEQKIFEMYIKE